MHIADLRVGRAWRHQRLREAGARREIVLALLARPVQAEQGDAHPAVGLELDRGFEKTAEPLRVPVGREPHDLVFVGVEVEPQVQRHDRVQDADRVRHADLEYPVQIAVTPVIHARALGLAHAVDHDDETLVPSRRVVRARRVRRVVRDVTHPFGGEARNITRHEREQRVARVHVAIQLVRHGVQRVDAPVGRIVEAVYQLVHVVDGETGLRQAVGDRALGKVSRVLAAADALFRHGRDYGTIHDQRRRRVVPLGDAVLTLVQVRPARSLERNGALEPADADDVQRGSFGDRWE